MDYAIRDAIHADAAGILPIYNHAALNTTGIWNDTASDLAQREAWLADRRARGYPVLVAEAAGAIIGFAGFGDFRPFDGYRHTVENSVYVDPAVHGQGIGRALLTALIPRACLLGKHVMVAGIESANAAGRLQIRPLARSGSDAETSDRRGRSARVIPNLGKSDSCDTDFRCLEFSLKWLRHRSLSHGERVGVRGVSV